MKALEVEYLGVTWIVLSAVFRTQAYAKAAWEELQAESAAAKGQFEIGIYRHGTPADPGRYVSVVSLKRLGLPFATRVFARHGGEAYLPEQELVESLIARKVAVMGALVETDSPSGTYTTRRGSKGGILRPDGTIDEQIGEG